MAIFQKSIIDKYLLTLDEGLIEAAFDTYKNVYVPKIARIRNLKEEQYQTQFLQDIFGSVLGYTIDPDAGYNIELEKKNESNSKKADGAINNLTELNENLTSNCIPESVFKMNIDDYDEFLIQRRRLMAQKMKHYYYSL